LASPLTICAAYVGQTVARLEGEIVLTALAKRVEAIELSGEPRRRLNNTLRGWAGLPVAVRRGPDVPHRN